MTPPCPKCRGQCVYDGNYFCIQCDWAFPHPDPPSNSLALQRWGVAAYRSLMAWRGEEPRPEALKLSAWKR